MAIVAMILLIPAIECAAAAPSANSAQTLEDLAWQRGPAAAPIGKNALLNVNEDIVFIDEANSSKFLELTGNLPGDGNYIIFNTKDRWWAGFSYEDSGYIKDDEKIDADTLLKQLRESDGPSNAERKRLGLSELHTEGWYVPPHYDPATKRLEWGVKLRSDNGYTANYTIRLLGRSGVTSATLVSGPDRLDENVRSFKAMLPGFEYKAGEKYSEFKQGDRVAEYGLAALIAGGAAAVATKKGLWGTIGAFLAASWKLVAGAAVAAAAGLKKLFSRNKQ